MAGKPGREVGSMSGTNTCVHTPVGNSAKLPKETRQLSCPNEMQSAFFLFSIVIYLSGRCFDDRNSGLHVGVSEEGNQKQKKGPRCLYV
jgi:hypothetical protein